MSDKIELSTGEPWRGLKPGMPRANALRMLEAAGANPEDDDTDPGWVLATAENWGMEMRFAEDGAQPLRQLVLDDWEAVWAAQPFANRPLHEALATLGDAARGAGWRPEDAVNEPFEDLKPPGAEPVADEELLRDGTLWLPAVGLGLVMCDGSVNEIVWRRPEDVPREFIGPVTEAQRQLSASPDLAERLNKHFSASLASSGSIAAPNPMQRALTFLLAVVLINIGFRAWQDTQRWRSAQTLPGRLVSIEKTTRKPWVDRYTIEYTDPSGRPQTAVLDHGEFYVQPRERGDETQVAYLAGDPPRVKGLARARDSAFIEYVPKAITAGLIYIVLWSTAGFVWRLKRASAPPPPPSTANPPPFTPDRGR